MAFTNASSLPIPKVFFARSSSQFNSYDGGNDDAAARHETTRDPIGDCYCFFASLRMCQEAERV